MIPNRKELQLLDLPEDPSEWPRIKVISEGGLTTWKYIPEVEDSDAIPCTKSGIPHCMYNNPGRPKPSEDPPPPEDADATEIARHRIRQRLRLKESAVNVDPIVQVARADVDSASILQMSIIALAEEAAALKYDRATAEQEGQIGSAYSMKRIKALETLVSKWNERKKMLDATSVDLDSKAFAVVFTQMVRSFTESLRKSDLDQETIDSVISNFVGIVNNDEWKADVKSQMSNLSR